MKDSTQSFDEIIPVRNRIPLLMRVMVGSIVIFVLLVGSFELVYANKILPGVQAAGVKLGGQSQVSAMGQIEDRTGQYMGHVLTIGLADSIERIPVNGLELKYDASASAKAAYAYGRTGSFTRRAHEQLGSILGDTKDFTVYSYSDTALTQHLLNVNSEASSAVQNASISYRDGEVVAENSISGSRLNLGQLVETIQARLLATSEESITAPVYKLEPSVTSSDLKQTAEQADQYLSTPLTLKYGSSSREVNQSTIAEWLNVTDTPQREFMVTKKLSDFYTSATSPELGVSTAAIKAYVADLASKVNQPAQNASLEVIDSKIVVSKASRDGVDLDQAASVAAISDAIGKSGDDRTISLKATITKADVREDNLEQLGLKELISEGVSSFPGSSKARIQNVAAGAKQFNGVLLKPGETFSFGKLLGAVGPEQGYLPELVILGDREEKQYGGGLCQVSSTAFRAALNAGLPIVERHNHSFAISFYTNPYGVPGVDATIYYPQVDFKFKNDTSSYILIQTTMQGTNLKFDYYGTKTKSGVIRGPQFITGDMDHTKPSRTVFYRDILDLNGAVTKTDTFYTNYQSSLDFPITPEYN